MPKHGTEHLQASPRLVRRADLETSLRTVQQWSGLESARRGCGEGAMPCTRYALIEVNKISTVETLRFGLKVKAQPTDLLTQMRHVVLHSSFCSMLHKEFNRASAMVSSYPEIETDKGATRGRDVPRPYKKNLYFFHSSASAVKTTLLTFIGCSSKLHLASFPREGRTREQRGDGTCVDLARKTPNGFHYSASAVKTA